MWNGSIKLQRTVENATDSDGYPIEKVSYLENVQANFGDLTRDDEILANQKGYTVDQDIEIMQCNYNGEAVVIDELNGNIYDVKRTFHKNKKKTIHLICKRR